MLTPAQRELNYIRVIRFDSSRRCQGSPSTKASNCSRVSVNDDRDDDDDGDDDGDVNEGEFE